MHHVDNETRHVSHTGLGLFVTGPTLALPVMAMGTHIALLAGSMIWFTCWLLSIVFGFIGREHMSGQIALVGPLLLGFTLWRSVPRDLPTEPDPDAAAAAQADP